MFRIERYEPRLGPEWNAFVDRAKNGVFLFRREYMDYHADRFPDYSLLIRQGNKLLAILPATRKADVVSSHGGLTFGGLLSGDRMRTTVMVEIVKELLAYLRTDGATKLVYKSIPHIYHRVPAEEDLYALYREGGRLVRRDVASTIPLPARVSPSKGRQWSTRRARANGLRVAPSEDFQTMMAIEEEQLLKKYGLRPTHTAEELALLAGRFPENIRLFAAFKEGVMVGGVVVYKSARVAHAQYIAATDEGRALGALDRIVDVLLNDVCVSVPYFDFGISTENSGRYLNVGLIDNKESYGARAIAYDWYELDLAV